MLGVGIPKPPIQISTKKFTIDKNYRQDNITLSTNISSKKQLFWRKIALPFIRVRLELHFPAKIFTFRVFFISQISIKFIPFFTGKPFYDNIPIF